MKANFANKSVFDFNVNAAAADGPNGLAPIVLEQNGISEIQWGSSDVPPFFSIGLSGTESGATGRATGTFFGPDANATGGFIFYEGLSVGGPNDPRRPSIPGLSAGTLTFEGTR